MKKPKQPPSTDGDNSTREPIAGGLTWEEKTRRPLSESREESQKEKEDKLREDAADCARLLREKRALDNDCHAAKELVRTLLLPPKRETIETADVNNLSRV